MKIKTASKVLTLIALIITTQNAFAGWNHQSRNSCKIWAKYTASANAGYKAYNQMGNYVGSSGYNAHDTGCKYAHAGPLKYFVDGSLVAWAESSIGNIGTIGYAYTWNKFDPIANLMKKGMADVISNTQDINSPDTEQTPDTNQTAGNLIVISSTTFNNPARTPSPAPPYIMLSGITGHLSAQAGYSTFEIIVSNSKNETPLATDKIVWKGKAIVHDNRLTILNSFSSKLFIPKATNLINKEIIYSLNNVDIKIPLAIGTNLDEIVITTKGDAGNKSILSESEYVTVSANNSPLPVINTKAISVINIDKNGKILTTTGTVTGN